jgi:cytochrome c oxidase subunit 2
MDLVPGRETSLWFKARSVGTFDVYCAEYCGLLHSKMLSKVHVMEPNEFNTWYANEKNN